MTKPITVLCIGDVFGEPGRKAVHALLPGLRKQHEADLAIVNVENAASGFGVTPLSARTFLEHGVDVMTSGNHIWDKKEIIEYIGKENLLLRPANFPVGTPGVGHVTVKAGPHKVAVLNLMGRVFMLPIDCPFQNADERVLPKGTAYITDLGMTGPTDSVIGVDKDIALQRFLSQMPNRFEPAKGPVALHGVVIRIDPDTGRGLSIERLRVSVPA